MDWESIGKNRRTGVAHGSHFGEDRQNPQSGLHSSTVNMASDMNVERSTITLTFGDQAENHVGMEKLGKMVESGMGFHLDDLEAIKLRFEEIGVTTVLHHLGDNAYLLVLQNAVDALLQRNDEEIPRTQADLFQEQAALNVDKHAFMYGRVVEKSARWNLCFDEEGQEPDYQHGKGRIISYADAPIMALVLSQFEEMFGPKAANLKGEGNYYYDVDKCGIGYHGDAERRKVIAIRLGAPNPIHYQWYQEGLPIREHMVFPLNGGDIYVMSEKTVGTDWRKKKIPTLRHAVGCAKYTALNSKPKPVARRPKKASGTR